MATYESLLQLNGTVGDLVFYQLNGKNVVRKKSGFNKNAYKKSPSYEKVRQNSSEFGHCSKVGKLIRNCISKYIAEAGEPLLYQKFAKLMTEIKDFDQNEKGKRTVLQGLKTEAGRKYLQEFQFGIIPGLKNLLIQKSLFNDILEVDDSLETDEIFLISIYIDDKNYTSAFYEDKLESTPLKKQFIIDSHFSNFDDILYFAALKKDGQIISMGFV